MWRCSKSVCYAAGPNKPEKASRRSENRKNWTWWTNQNRWRSKKPSVILDQEAPIILLFRYQQTVVYFLLIYHGKVAAR